jgi:hypothetical protein
LPGERERRTSKTLPSRKIAPLTASWGRDGWTGADTGEPERWGVVIGRIMPDRGVKV